MLTLFHHPFCPHSRFIRLALAEHGLEHRVIEERVWERREEFLMLNVKASKRLDGFTVVRAHYGEEAARILRLYGTS